MSRLLELRDIKRHFGGLWAANGVNMEIAAGEIHALIGPNGAGKTTLIHLISGSLRPDSGHLLFSGKDITHCNMHDRVALGISRSYQITQIFPTLSLFENVRLAVQGRQRDFGSSFNFWHPVTSDSQVMRESEEWLTQLELAHAMHSRASDISHGEKRVLELAMALATRPKLLLLDEPMAGMGAEESEKMAALIASLRGKQTILLVEHDLDIVFRLADRISVLVSGRVIACDTPDMIRTHPEVQQAYLGAEAA